MSRSDPTMCADGSEPLMRGVQCHRCGLTDWRSYESVEDIRCGGCGLWFVMWFLETLGGEEVDMGKVRKVEVVA